MNASQNEVQMILNAIDDVRRDVSDVRSDVKDARSDMAKMDTRINGRIRTLERFRWQIVGGAAVMSVLMGLALRVATF